MPLAPGPVGLKFWTPAGIGADNADDTGSLPASVGEQFNPWGPKRPVQDWVCGSPPWLITEAAPPDTDNLPAGAGNWFNPWGRRRPVQDWFKGAIPTVPVTFTAGGGSYTLTGTATGVAFRHVAGSGSYTITGTNAGLGIPVTFTAAGGSYTLTGSAASFVIPGGVDYLPAGMSGGYVPWHRPYPTALLTRTGRPLSEVPVSPADTINLPAGITGGFNPWRRPYPVSLLTSVSRLPPPASPVVLTAAGGNYTITGFAAALVIPGAVVNMPAGMSGGYVPWGRRYPTALLTRTGRPLAEAGSLTLTASAGSYTITGSSAALALRLTANSGSYTVSGTAAVLARGFAAGAGAYAILGTAAQLVQAGSITLACGAGSYTLTGSDVSFAGITPPAAVGGYAGGVHRGRMIRKFRKRRREEDDELPQTPQLPPAVEAPPQTPQIPRIPHQPGLMADMPAPAPAKISKRSVLDDDEDEDEVALLLELLSRIS